MDKNKWDIEQPIEKQQYGAVNAGVSQEEWMKPKSDKVVLYHLKKKTESLYSGMYNSISYCYWWYDRSIANANGIL